MNEGLLPKEALIGMIKRHESLTQTEDVYYAIEMLRCELEMHGYPPGSDGYQELEARKEIAGQIVDLSAIRLIIDPEDEVTIAKIDLLKKQYRKSGGQTLEEVLGEFGRAE